jgi:DNA-binding transcriptional regulator YiaG
MKLDLARFDLDAKGLAKARQDLRWTQRELAVCLGVSTATVAQWEGGRHKVPPYVGLAIEFLADTRGTLVRGDVEVQ